MATVTSLGFNITAKWDGAGLKAAQAQLDSLKKTLSSIDGQNLRITADVDDSAARSKLEALKSIATNQTIHIGVDVDDAALTQLRDTLDRFGHTRYVAQADVNANTAALDAVRVELERFGTTHATATADVDVSTAGAHLHELTTDLGGANSGFDNFRNAANTASFASSAFSLAGLATVGVLAAIGPAASLAGTALVTGLGGGFIAVGALILSQNAQVKASMTDLKNSVMSDMQQAAEGMKGPLLDGIAQLKAGLAQLEPAFAQAFTAAGPLIQPLVQSFLNFTGAVMPGFIAAIKSAGPVFAGMASGMQTLGAGLGDMFRGLAAGAQGFGQMWQVVGTQVGAILGTLGQAMGQMASVGATALNNILIGVNGLLGGLLQAVMPLIAPLGLLTRAIGVDLGNALRLAGPGIGQLVTALVSALVPVLNILLPVLGQVVGILAASLVPVIQVLSPLLTMFATGLATILNFLRPILPVLVPLIAGLWLLNAALLANPAVLIAAGIVLLVGAIVELSTHWTTVWNGIKLVAETVWNFLTTGWGRLILAFSPIGWLILLATNWSTVWNAIKIAATTVWTALQIAWSAFINALALAWTVVGGAFVIAWNATWNAMSLTVRTIWAALQIAWSAFITALATAWTVVSAALQIAWSAVWNAMSLAARTIWNALQVAWSAFITAMATTWTVVSAALSAAWSAVWNAMSAVARAIWTALQAAWSAFINALTTVWNAASAALQATWSAAWNAMKTVATTIWNALQTAWKACVTALTNFMTESTNTMKSIWSAAWNAIKSAAQAVWNALETAWKACVTTLTNYTTSATNTIKSIWSAAWNAIKSAAQAVWNALASAWHACVTTLTNYTSSATSTIKSIWSSAWNAIRSAAETVWNAMRSAYNTFKGRMVDATHDLVSGMSKAWSAIKEAFEKPIHFVIDTVINGGIIKAANWVIDKLGGGGNTIPKIPVPFATGGYVAGPGSGTSDSIPARLSNGEYVLRADAVRKIGVDNLHQMNRTGQMLGGNDQNKNRLTAMFGGAVDPKTNPQLADAIAGYAGGMADGGLTDNDLVKVFEDAIKAVGGTAADVLSNMLGGAVEAGGDVAGDIIGGIGGIFGHPHAGDSLKHHGKDVADAIQGAFAMLEDAAMGGITDKVFDMIADKLLGGITGTDGPLGAAGLGFGKTVGKEMLSGVIKKAFESFLTNQKQQAEAVYAESVAGSKSVKAWAPTVLKALSMEGLPTSWLGPILSMMQQESGGNPNAINRTDSNAKAGIPSQGLMQTIPPTFAAYHWPGTSNNILDPLANIAAALNYIKHRYGYPPGSPYAAGTTSATPGVHLVGEEGPEMVLFGGGETVKNAADTSAILSASSAGGAVPTVSSGPATSDKQLADSLAAWQDYMAQIQTISDTAWADVANTAAANWADMQSNSGPFVAAVTKAFSDGGTAVSTGAKTTWDAVSNAATTSWDAQGTAAATFNADIQKQFSDSGNAIQSKWASDLAAGTAATVDSFSSQTQAADAFGADIQKTYADTADAIETTWTESLASSSAATAQYWTDVSGANATGTADLQTGLINPVSTMLTTQLPAAFNESITAIGTGWENLKKTVRDPVAAVVDVVFNKGIVAMWNAIAGTFDAPTLDTFTMPAYATGGQVSGPGTGTSDSITARLSNGEHVWTAAEVQAAGGHGNVAALRQSVLGGASAVRMLGANGRYADGGAVVGAPQGGTSSQQGTASTGDPLKDAANAPLGSIKDISNPFITAAGDAGKAAIANLLPGTSGYGTLLGNMVDQMVGTVTGWITANDVLPTIGGVNDAAAQAWADAQVGKPYALGGNFGATFDCSQYMSGIARAILGETPAPWFTTFAFSGDTAPSGFERELTAPFMIGITNVGVGHTAGTLNGTNYEATPPAVRSGPSARGYDDPMFQDWYGFRPSIEASIGTVTDANHLAIIDAAMAAAGVPPPDSVAAWEAGMNTIINRESGWDPNAINNYDSNAAAGMPSQGLAQVIPPTFAAYHVAGTSDNILDPIANVAAAINYIVHTYGSIGNVQQANPNLPPKGYAQGTWGAQSGWHRVGEDGPEWVKFRGGEQVFPYGVNPDGRGGGGGNITVENHFHGPVTKEALEYAEGPFSEKLRQACKAGVGKR